MSQAKSAQPACSRATARPTSAEKSPLSPRSCPSWVGTGCASTLREAGRLGVSPPSGRRSSEGSPAPQASIRRLLRHSTAFPPETKNVAFTAVLGRGRRSKAGERFPHAALGSHPNSSSICAAISAPLMPPAATSSVETSNWLPEAGYSTTPWSAYHLRFASHLFAYTESLSIPRCSQ